MTTTAISLNVKDGVAHIELQRPDEGNWIDDDFVRDLDAITLRCADDAAVRAILLTSTGEKFSVGGNIRGFTADRASLPGRIRKWNASLNASIARLQRVNAPCVAAVHGPVAGGALSIISGFDVIVASPNARFVSAYATIGYCPDLGGTISLARRVGVARARRFHLLHETLSAEAALEIGLVDVLTKVQDLAPRAWEIARRWAEGPTQSYGEIRRLMQDVSLASLESQLETETRGIARLAASDDAWEALTAFLAKRKPRFAGK